MNPAVLRGTAAAGALALTLALLAACGDDADSGISTGTVTKGEVAETVEAPAQITARSTVTVSSPADGTVDRVEAADGERVRRGDVILVIDSPSAERTLAQAQEAQRQASGSPAVDLPSADIDGAVAQADRAASDAFEAADRAIDLIPDQPTRAQARAQLEQQRAAYAAARARAVNTAGQIDNAIGQLESAVSGALGGSSTQLDNAVAAAQRTIDALTVRAPTQGVVTLGVTGSGGAGGLDTSSLLSSLPSSLQGAASSVLGDAGSSGASAGAASSVEPGLPVSSGQGLATITDTSTLGLSAQVDETDILLVKDGIDAEIQLDAVPDATYRARVTAIGVTPTTSSRGGVSYVVRLSLGAGTDADGQRAPTPRPGMSAVALLKVRTAKNVVVVPAAAVFREEGRDQVWVVSDGKAERRTVRIAAEGADTIGIRTGLKAGETIVTRGADRVQQGQELP